MPHAYTEDQLVEQPAIGLFAELGWAVAGPPPNAGVPGEPRDAGLLGRETKGEVVLVSRLRAAFERLNPALPPEAITAAVDELTRDSSAMGLPAANREVYRLLKDGIVVSIAAPEAPPSPRPFSQAPYPHPNLSQGERRWEKGEQPLPLPLGEGSRVRVTAAMVRSVTVADNGRSESASLTGKIPPRMISCWSASSASRARSTPAAQIWSASSTGCRWWSSS
jgi:hypothetical protein